VGRRELDHDRAQLPGHDHHDARAGMTFWRMPLLVWANFSTSTLRRARDAVHRRLAVLRHVRPRDAHELLRVRARNGGYVLGYQHIFWFYSHPAVYIMILPGFGLISEIIAVMSRKPIFGYRLMALSLMAILVLGFSVWAHHMFVAGMASWLRVPMMVTSMVIAVPTGVKVFSWLATMWNGRLHFNTPMLFATGFVSMFVLGGLSGIYLASVPIDIHASDTYFIVAHIHYVLFGGSVFTIFAGIYYWFPKMTGRMYDERSGSCTSGSRSSASTSRSSRCTSSACRGCRAESPDYSDRFADVNLFISIASFGLGASTLVFLYNMARSWAHGARAPGNPWRALTLEWQVSSPPPIFNFDEIPQVVGNPYEYGVPARGTRSSARRRPRRCRRTRWAIDGSYPRHRERDRGVADAARRAARRAAERRPRDGDRAGQRAEPGLRRLRRHARAPRPAAGSSRRLRPARAGRSRAGLRRRDGPVQAAKDALAQLEPPPDEIVVSTHAASPSGWMRRDVVAEIERAARGVPRAPRRRRTTRRRPSERARDREPDGHLATSCSNASASAPARAPRAS
jgi:hypothetical protein